METINNAKSVSRRVRAELLWECGAPIAFATLSVLLCQVDADVDLLCSDQDKRCTVWHLMRDYELVREITMSLDTSMNRTLRHMSSVLSEIDANVQLIPICDDVERCSTTWELVRLEEHVTTFSDGQLHLALN